MFGIFFGVNKHQNLNETYVSYWEHRKTLPIAVDGHISEAQWSEVVVSLPIYVVYTSEGDRSHLYRSKLYNRTNTRMSHKEIALFLFSF